MNEVEAFFLEFRGQQKELFCFLHDYIIAYPNLTPKIRYKLPFYYGKSWICYLAPTKTEEVELAFTRGDELSNEQGLLNARGRKQVYSVYFSDIKQIPQQALSELLQEAILLDKEILYKSKRSKS